MIVTPPEPVPHSAVHHPVVWPHGPTYYLVETGSHRIGSATPPLIRDATGRPMTLRVELAPGTVVQIAVGSDGMTTAIKIVSQAWADPFAVAA